MSKKRVTLVLPEELDKDVEVYSAIQGLQKNEVIAAAISSYLSSEGYDSVSRAIQKFRKREEQEPRPTRASSNFR